MSNTFDKLSVLDSFIEEVNSYLPEIEANLERLAHIPDDMEALEETYRRSHTIGGSASMMDFPGLAHVAHGMEDILGDVLDGLTTLDPPTIGLLQRSLGRMHRLLDGIRTGINEDSVMAEDDADYSQYRVMIETAARNEGNILSHEVNKLQVAASTAASFETPIASLEDMLASFRTPTAAMGEEVSWPEEPVPDASSNQTAYLNQDTQPHQRVQFEVPALEAAQPSALEMLAATARGTAPLDPTPVTPQTTLQNQDVRAGSEAKAVSSELALRTNEPTLTQIYSDLQEETQVLEDQASYLKRTLTQLRLAVSVIEGQRTEFRGFLDGSKDALDRMEEWAGRAMGLNLRNSPEQVRRYLPLSVMWVANSKLKKVLDLLTQMTSSVEMTDEQMQGALQQLRSSIELCGDAFEQLQSNLSAHLFTQDAGWTPWEMQVAREALRERVTFERRGDPAVLRAEIEARLREELRQEYEARPLTLAARTELEQQIRNEIRQEFEAKRQLQVSVAGSDPSETLQEIEARLRNEIEIEVRREFLSQLTGEMDEASAPTPASPGQSTAPFASAASTSTTLPPPPRPATPVVSTYSSVSAPSVGSEFAEEAAELFRLEAEEHLKTISMNVAALENAPADRDHIQGIRRAIHTLKGAARMMGFRAIA